MEHSHGHFSIPAIRPFVPEWVKPWILIAFVIIIQFSGGVYLASVSEMVGSTALMQEDIMMAGYASLAGMSLTFVVMMRLKFAIPPRTTFYICGIVIIGANLICMHTHSVPLLVATCFIAGFFRMWATFMCNTTIQLWLTPTRDLSVFFSYIYLLVNGAIQLSGLLTVHIASWASWEYMQWCIIALMGFLLLAVTILFRNYQDMPRLPLYGIDWLGMLMWGFTLLCIIFVCVYGEHYDWFDSVHIQSAAIMGLVLLLLNLWRASFIRHPFIFLKTFKFPIVGISLVIYIIADILLAPSHIFEHALMEGILGYDALHTISLNWIAFAGTVSGAVFTYLTFARRKWKYQTMLGIAFTCYTIYLAYFYFYIDYDLPKEDLYFPIFVRSFGYVTMAICLLTALTSVPFPHHFFQAVAIQGFASAACASVIGTAIIGRVFNIVMKKNYMLLGMNLDHVNPTTSHIHLGNLYGITQQHALMISMKEIYGWLLFLALGCLLFFLLYKSSLRPFGVIHPKFSTIRKTLKHELRIRMKFRNNKN